MGLLPKFKGYLVGDDFAIGCTMATIAATSSDFSWHGVQATSGIFNHGINAINQWAALSK